MGVKAEAELRGRLSVSLIQMLHRLPKLFSEGERDILIKDWERLNSFTIDNDADRKKYRLLQSV